MTAYFASVWEEESRFVGDVRDMIFTYFTSFYWPSLAMEGLRLPGTLNRMRCIEVLNTYVGNDNKDPLIWATHVLFWMKDPLMHIRRDYGVL